ncbi:hypothetical protein AB1L42_08650 [Thalassoglobus sp. JC818]|uniref:hypothetical protein n=1 Tax=Thalassoglobus sp. JC818 TaxID=3232136 RepID=UPI00345918E2
MTYNAQSQAFTTILLLLATLRLGCFSPARIEGPTFYDAEWILRSAISDINTKGEIVFFNTESACVSRMIGDLNELNTRQEFSIEEALVVIDFYASVCVDNEQQSQVHLVRGMLLLSANRNEQALEAYNKSIELSEETWQPYFHRAFYFHLIRDDQAAEVDRKKVKAVYPNAPLDQFSYRASHGGLI